MDHFAQLDAAVLSRVLALLPQRNALALTMIAPDWPRLVAAHLCRLIVSPDLSSGLARTAAMHCVRLREVVFQSGPSASPLASDVAAIGFWAHAAAIWRSLLTCPAAPIRQLTIRGSAEEAESAEFAVLAELRGTLESCRDLQILHMEHVPAGTNERIADLFHVLQSLPLTSLRLRNCSLKAAGCISLCHALQQAPLLRTLSDLDLSQNVLSEEVAGALAELLPRMQELRALSLSGNGLGPVGLGALLPGLPSTLRHLDLSFNGLGTVGLALLLEVHLNLESLNIRGNWLGSTDTEVLPRLLRPMSDTMTSLDIAPLGRRFQAVLESGLSSVASRV